MIHAKANTVVKAEHLWYGVLVAGSLVAALFVSFPTLG
jgi:hypothetical protein